MLIDNIGKAIISLHKRNLILRNDLLDYDLTTSEIENIDSEIRQAEKVKANSDN